MKQFLYESAKKIFQSKSKFQDDIDPLQNPQDNQNFFFHHDDHQSNFFVNSKNEGNSKENHLNNCETFFAIKDEEQIQKITPQFNRSKNLPIESSKKFSHLEWSIKQFQICYPLGSGQYGKVYFARERKSKLFCALKKINLEKVQREGYEKQMRREIEIHSGLNHPNIIKMFGYFWSKSYFYYILEYMPNDLYTELHNQPLGRFEETLVSQFIKQMIDAIMYLHKKGIIHRDIKPENILVCENLIKLSDFGWSCYVYKQQRETRCGTLEYMAPELTDCQKYTQSVDIWGIGVLCFELATGEPPFNDMNRKNIQKLISKMEYVFPSYLSKDIKDFISSFLQRKKEHRITLKNALSHPFITKYNQFIFYYFQSAN